MIEIFFGVLVIGLAVLLLHLRQLSEQWNKLKNVPALPSHPVIGHALLFFGKSPTEILKVLWDTQKKLGKVVKYNLTDSIGVVISDPKITQVSFLLKM